MNKVEPWKLPTAQKQSDTVSREHGTQDTRGYTAVRASAAARRTAKQAGTVTCCCTAVYTLLLCLREDVCMTRATRHKSVTRRRNRTARTERASAHQLPQPQQATAVSTPALTSWTQFCCTPLQVLSEYVTSSSFDGVHFGRTTLERPGNSLNGVLVTGADGMLGAVERWRRMVCCRVHYGREQERICLARRIALHGALCLRRKNRDRLTVDGVFYVKGMANSETVHNMPRIPRDERQGGKEQGGNKQRLPREIDSSTRSRCWACAGYVCCCWG